MSALLILVMIAVPAVCFAWMLPGLDALGRAMVGLASSLCLLVLVAQGMIILRVWSPLGGLVAVALVCGIAVPIARRRRGADAVVPAQGRAHDDEDWIFDE